MRTVNRDLLGLAAALALAACLLLGAPRASCSPPPAPPERGDTWQTPLGTFQLDPQVRQRIEELKRTLSETARDLGRLLDEKATLSPEQEKRLQEMLDRLKERLRRFEGPGEKDEDVPTRT